MTPEPCSAHQCLHATWSTVSDPFHTFFSHNAIALPVLKFIFKRPNFVFSVSLSYIRYNTPLQSNGLFLVTLCVRHWRKTSLKSKMMSPYRVFVAFMYFTYIHDIILFGKKTTLVKKNNGCATYGGGGGGMFMLCYRSIISRFSNISPSSLPFCQHWTLLCLLAILQLLSVCLSLLVCQFATYLHGSLNKYQAEIRCAKLTDYNFYNFS